MTTKNINDQINAPLELDRMQEKIDLLSSSPIPKEKAIEILTSPVMMLDYFRTRLPEIFPQGSSLKECKPRVLRDRQHSRQVLSYRLLFSHPSMRKTLPINLVAKRFIDRAKGKHEYLAMRILWENGFDRKSDLRVPRPFSFFEDLGLLIQERAHGTLLRKKLNRHSPAASGGLKAAARWLIKLHHIDADHEGIREHPDDETLIRGCMHRIGNREPKLLPKLEEVGSLTRMKLSFFRNFRFTLVHGDFQCDNIFIDKGRVTVIDFGRFCKSDPARDLACMIAQARTISFLETASFEPVLPGLKAFWEEYLTAVPMEEREGLSRRICMFAAIKFLENIDYISAFSPAEGKDVWRFLLDDAELFAKANTVEEIL